MCGRDILPEEVEESLRYPKSRHRRGKVVRRLEVRYNVGQRTLLVVYRRRRGRILVINAMWE